MLTAPELHAIAREIRAAQLAVRQLEPLTTRIERFDVPSAYEVAHLVHAARLEEGAIPVGRKIGFTNPDMWDRYGVREPVWGYMYDSTVRRLSANQATCSVGEFADPKIEPEIVLHFRSTPPVGADLSAILESIDWVAHGFEIVQSHFPGWTFQAADTIADGALHGTLLLGEPRSVRELAPDLSSALESFSLALSCNANVREVGRGSNVLGSPLLAIAHLLTVLSKQPQYPPLQANEIVTTGTITAAFSVRAGETWHTTLEGIALPGLMVEFVA